MVGVWRVQGLLATSRSLGDQYLKPHVSSEPEVTVLNRLDSDEFVIMATDGLFDVVCNNLACQVVKKCLSGRYLVKRQSTSTATTADQENVASEAAAALAELAIAKGSRDNVSVIVVQLK